jgi:hypothetical protein
MKGFIWAIGIAMVVAVIACSPETPVSTPVPKGGASDEPTATISEPTLIEMGAPVPKGGASDEPTATISEPTLIESGTRLRGAFALEGKRFRHGRIGEPCQGYERSRDIGPWLSVSVYDSTFKLIDEVQLQAGVTNGSRCLLHWESSLTPSYRYRVCLWHCVRFESGGFDSDWIDSRALEQFDYSVQWNIKSDFVRSRRQTLPNILR